MTPSRGAPGWVVPLVVIVVLGVVAAGVVFAVRSSDEGDSAAPATTVPFTKETAPPSTTIPRVTQVDLLREYCNAPGTKWPEVPPHVPGEPDRTQVRFLGGGVASAADSRGEVPAQLDSSNTLGGSTVISPRTDGVFTDDASVLERTRTVTCVTFIATDPAGPECQYNDSQFGFTGSYVTMTVATNRYAITVYELHSGGILHKGEIHTRTGGCPGYAVTSLGAYVAYGLTDQDILSWLSTHFVGGKPA